MKRRNNLMGNYLTDITSSEGNIKRMSNICKGIAEIRVATKSKTTNMIEELGIRHPKVIGRHLHIVKFLGLVVDRGEFFSLSSEGKVLSAANESRIRLSTNEKLLFFMLFFQRIPDQLYWLLFSIRKNDGERTSRDVFERSVIFYFSLPHIQRIWNRDTLMRSIERYNETHHLPRGIENKFETMCSWLQQLDLVKRTPRLCVTRKGRRILHSIEDNWSTPEMRKTIAAYNMEDYDRALAQREIVKPETLKGVRSLVNESLEKFSNEAKLCDLASVRLYSFLLTLSNHNLILSEIDLQRILKELKEEGKIKSFILDRKGQLSILQLS